MHFQKILVEYMRWEVPQDLRNSSDYRKLFGEFGNEVYRNCVSSDI